MLCWTPVRIHCHQFAGFCSIVKSVALPRLADALHVFSAAAPAPVFTADFSLCSWRFVNLSHKLLQSLAATWTWQLDVSDGCAALVLVVSPTFTILLFFFCLCADPRKRSQDAVYRKLGHLEFTACTFFSSSSSRVPLFTVWTSCGKLRLTCWSVC